MTARNKMPACSKITARGKDAARAKPAETSPRIIETLARRHAAAAVSALAAVLVDENATPAVRISAASALLQWGYGRPGAQVKGKPVEAGEQTIRLTWGEAQP